MAETDIYLSQYAYKSKDDVSENLFSAIAPKLIIKEDAETTGLGDKNTNIKVLESKSQHGDAKAMIGKILVDPLATEWRLESQPTQEQMMDRLHLVDNCLPVIVMGMEALSRKVEQKNIQLDNIDPDFNPTNYLARYIMRNNPRFNRSNETSPYVRGLRKVAAELRKNLSALGDSKMANTRMSEGERWQTREQRENQVSAEKTRRNVGVESQYLDWGVGPQGAIEGILIQNSINSFLEIYESRLADIYKNKIFWNNLRTAVVTSQLLTYPKYEEFLVDVAGTMPNEVFDIFLLHLSKCAATYRKTTLQEHRRVSMVHLFRNCDQSGIGLVDRHRLIQLFEGFYTTLASPVRQNLNDPRRWPVIEADEELLSQVDDGEETDSEDRGSWITSPDTKRAASTDSPESGRSSAASARAEGQKFVNEISNTLTTAADQVDEATPGLSNPDIALGNAKSDEELLTVAKPAEAKEATHIEEETEDTTKGSEEHAVAENLERIDSDAAAAIIDEGEIPAHLQRDSTNMSLGAPELNEDAARNSASKNTRKSGISTRIGETPESQTRTNLGEIMSDRADSRALTPFNPDTLNVQRFVAVVETFLGVDPPEEVFTALLAHLAEGYVETEEEKFDRLKKAKRETVNAKRHQDTNMLYEKWDNEGQGFVDLDELQNVLEKYKNGQEQALTDKATEEWISAEDRHADRKVTKDELHSLLGRLADALPGDESHEFLMTFLDQAIQVSFSEKQRGDLRKKWLGEVKQSADTSGASMDPVYRQVFKALYKDAELHGGNKHINAYAALLEGNIMEPARGSLCLRYVACTPADSPHVLGQILYQDMPNISFGVVVTGRPIHVPRVIAHGSVQFLNARKAREIAKSKEPGRKVDVSDKDGSLVVVPLKTQQKKCFGILGVDTLGDAQNKGIFVTHEIKFLQGVGCAIGEAHRAVQTRLKSLRLMESAMSWLFRRAPHALTAIVYIVEPGTADEGIVLRKMLSAENTGDCFLLEQPPRLFLKDNFFREYLWQSVEGAVTLQAEAYGEHHLVFPLRDEAGFAVAVLDLGLGYVQKLPPGERRHVQKIVKLLQDGQRQLYASDGSEKESMFDLLMLSELRQSIGRLTSERAFAELRSYNHPPEAVHNLMQVLLTVLYPREDSSTWNDWSRCKGRLNIELQKKIASFEPSAGTIVMTKEAIEATMWKLSQFSDAVPQSSRPTQMMFDWVFVCLSLLDHGAKQQSNEVVLLTPPPEALGLDD